MYLRTKFAGEMIDRFIIIGKAIEKLNGAERVKYMEWIQGLMPFVYLIAILTFIWGWRKDSKEDYSKMETKLEAWRQESQTKLEEWRRETNTILKAIQDEMKEFHGRLCAIESGRK